MSFSPLINQLIESLRCLPGVGPKSAQRMAFYLLERARANGKHLAKTLELAMAQIGHCQTCHTFTEAAQCALCLNPHRDSSLLCVVESPIDVMAIEQTGSYQGKYFVLMGRLSPIDGIGPNELGIDNLAHLLRANTVKELILATNPTVEGEVTAHYIADLAQQYGIKSSRIAHGVPVGGELEFVDTNTLTRAFLGRTLIES